MVGLHRADCAVSDGFDGGSPFKTAFERIGGEPALSAIVEQLFDRVLVDPELSRFFVDAAGDPDDLHGSEPARSLADPAGAGDSQPLVDAGELESARVADLGQPAGARVVGVVEVSRDPDEYGGRGGQEHGRARVGATEKVDLAALRRMFGQLIAGQLGAQTNYEGRNLRQAHRGLAISSGDYDRMSELFVETLWDNQVPDDIVLVTAEKLAALKPLIVEVFRPACVTG